MIGFGGERRREKEKEKETRERSDHGGRDGGGHDATKKRGEWTVEIG